VLDVKWGSGAFMRSREDSLELARALVEVGKRYGKKVVALQTDMNQPLGQQIGNALEIRECLDLMAGTARADDLMEVTLALSAEMLVLGGVAKNVATATEMLQKKLASGEALKKFHEFVAAQGGNAEKLPAAKQRRPIPAPRAGYVRAIECDQIGYAVIALGGGRRVARDKIDFGVGFEQPKKIGDRVEQGEPLMIMHYNDAGRAAEAERMVQAAYDIQPEPVAAKPQLITERIA
jgi:pyrimidine-nucleoside phosphorylase